MTKYQRELINELEEMKERISFSHGADKNALKRKSEILAELNKISARYKTARSDKGLSRVEVDDDFGDFGMF